MIKVTIELFPKGSEENSRLLGECYIANDGTGTVNRGNYDYVLFNKLKRKFKSGKVSNFNRKNETVWKLLKKCLEDSHAT